MSTSEPDPSDPFARIRAEARRIIVDPAVAAGTSAFGRRIAWLIEANAHGTIIPQRHRAPGGGPRFPNHET